MKNLNYLLINNDSECYKTDFDNLKVYSSSNCYTFMTRIEFKEKVKAKDCSTCANFGNCIGCTSKNENYVKTEKVEEVD